MANIPADKNVGHGHVYPRPDGVKARCGGPAICHVCAADLARKNIAEKVQAPVTSKQWLSQLGWNELDALLAKAYSCVIGGTPRELDEAKHVLNEAAAIRAYMASEWRAHETDGCICDSRVPVPCPIHGPFAPGQSLQKTILPSDPAHHVDIAAVKTEGSRS